MSHHPDKNSVARKLFLLWLVFQSAVFFSKKGDVYATETENGGAPSRGYCVALTAPARDWGLAQHPGKKQPSTAIIYDLTENRFDVLSLAYISKEIVVLDRRGCRIRKSESMANDAPPALLPAAYTFRPQADTRCLSSLEDIVLHQEDIPFLPKPRTSVVMGAVAKFVYMQAIDALEGYFIVHVDVTKKIPFEIKTTDEEGEILVIE
jgi:hypothetical protein